MTAFEYTACIGPLRTSRRIYRIQKACRLLLLLVVVSLLLFARREGLLHLLIRKRQHLQPTTVESQTTPVVNVPHAHDDDPSSHVTPTIISRGVGVSSSCNRKYDDSSLARVSSRGLRLFIAALLHNNEDVVDVWADEVLRLARLFPGSFVSVLESGSTDNTPKRLERLRSDLRTAGISERVIYGAEGNAFVDSLLGGGAPFTPGKPETGNRIAFLARLRNAVLDPLLEQAEEAARKKHVGDSKIRGSGGGGGIIDEGTDRLDEAGIAGGSPSDGGRGGRGAGIMTEGMVLHGGDDDDHKAGAGGNGSAASQRKEAYAKVVFLNDVAFCAGDVVQLLTHDAAHVACGYDFQNRPGPHNVPPGPGPEVGIFFWDNWVMDYGSSDGWNEHGCARDPLQSPRRECPDPAAHRPLPVGPQG